MSRLIQAGLVKRQKSNYFVTTLGWVIYSAQTNLEAKIENALNNYWRLNVLDSLEVSSRHRNEVICVLIDDEEIRSVLMKEEPNLSAQAVVKKTRDPILTVCILFFFFNLNWESIFILSL
jgi:hypothetical protein